MHSGDTTRQGRHRSVGVGAQWRRHIRVETTGVVRSRPGSWRISQVVRGRTGRFVRRRHTHSPFTSWANDRLASHRGINRQRAVASRTPDQRPADYAGPSGQDRIRDNWRLGRPAVGRRPIGHTKLRRTIRTKRSFATRRIGQRQHCLTIRTTDFQHAFPIGTEVSANTPRLNLSGSGLAAIVKTQGVNNSQVSSNAGNDLRTPLQDLKSLFELLPADQLRDQPAGKRDHQRQRHPVGAFVAMGVLLVVSLLVYRLQAESGWCTAFRRRAISKLPARQQTDVPTSPHAG